ncbi:TMEM175 family protein [Phormidesmis sp. 146-12]
MSDSSEFESLAPKPRAPHSNERLMFFSDGIFAITITLLVIEIKVPELHDVPVNEIAPALFKELAHLMPSIWGCIISFMILGLYWIAHHNMFMSIKHHNHTLLWLNTFFLMCIASVPFTTALISHYPDQQIAVVSYAAVLTLTGIVLNLIWWYSSTHHLLEEGIEPEFITFVHRYIRIAPIVYALSILASFISVNLAEFMLIAVSIYYIIPKRYHRKHYRQLERRFNQ